jgi:penicillin V acylase-like amidase (Ntn superfamily)
MDNWGENTVNKRAKIGGLFLSVALMGSVFACSNVAVSGNGYTAVARSMDLTINTGNVFALGRRGEKNTSDLNMGPADATPVTWVNSHNFMGQTGMAGPDILDGINDAGVYVGFLYLPAVTQYPAYHAKRNKPVLGIANLLNYILGTSSSVNEALKKLSQVQLVISAAPLYPKKQKGVYAIFPIHAVIRDKTGDSAVLEFVGGKTVIYHPAGNVMTNSPVFSWQLKNAAKYHFATIQESHKTFDGLPMHGSGFWGVPGDWTPPSRFARATQVVRNMPTPKNEQDALQLAMMALETMQVPLGTNPSATIWESLADLNQSIYYFKNMYSVEKPTYYHSVLNVMHPWQRYNLPKIAQEKSLPPTWVSARLHAAVPGELKKMVNFMVEPKHRAPIVSPTLV